MFDDHEALREKHEDPRQFNVRLPHQSHPKIDVEALAATMVLLSLRETMDFVLALHNAFLDDPTSKMPAPTIARLRNPPVFPFRSPIMVFTTPSPSILSLSIHPRKLMSVYAGHLPSISSTWSMSRTYFPVTPQRRS